MPRFIPDSPDKDGQQITFDALSDAGLAALKTIREFEKIRPEGFSLDTHDLISSHDLVARRVRISVRPRIRRPDLRTFVKERLQEKSDRSYLDNVLINNVDAMPREVLAKIATLYRHHDHYDFTWEDER